MVRFGVPMVQTDLVRALPHRRAPRPIHFPSKASVPETLWHMLLRTLIFEALRRSVGRAAAVGSDQFVYFNASNPRRCVAPDAFVKLGGDPTPFPVWKTWERGAPELAIEVMSDSDANAEGWDEKLAKYHEMGVRELVAFEMNKPAGERLRVWDRIDEDLLERAIVGDKTLCATLGRFWVVGTADDLPVALRLSEDAEGKRLVPSSAEETRQAKMNQDAEAEARKAAEARAICDHCYDL